MQLFSWLKIQSEKWLLTSCLDTCRASKSDWIDVNKASNISTLCLESSTKRLGRAILIHIYLLMHAFIFQPWISWKDFGHPWVPLAAQCIYTAQRTPASVMLCLGWIKELSSVCSSGIFQQDKSECKISRKFQAQTFLWTLKFISTHYWSLFIKSGSQSCIQSWIIIFSFLKTPQLCGSSHISICWCQISYGGKCVSSKNSQISTFPEYGFTLVGTP